MNKRPERVVVETWVKLFPEKKLNRQMLNRIEDNLENRWNDEWFRDNWLVAMTRASKSDWCHRSAVFNLFWFSSNIQNVEKCLAGNYDNDGTSQSEIKKDYYGDPYSDYLQDYDEDEWNRWNDDFDKAHPELIGVYQDMQV